MAGTNDFSWMGLASMLSSDPSTVTPWLANAGIPPPDMQAAMLAQTNSMPSTQPSPLVTGDWTTTVTPAPATTTTPSANTMTQGLNLLGQSVQSAAAPPPPQKISSPNAPVPRPAPTQDIEALIKMLGGAAPPQLPALSALLRR